MRSSAFDCISTDAWGIREQCISERQCRELQNTCVAMPWHWLLILVLGLSPGVIIQPHHALGATTSQYHKQCHIRTGAIPFRPIISLSFLSPYPGPWERRDCLSFPSSILSPSRCTEDRRGATRSSEPVTVLCGTHSCDLYVYCQANGQVQRANYDLYRL